MTPLAAVVGLVAPGAEEHARRMQQLGKREDDHQRSDQRQMHQQRGIGGQRTPVKIDQAEEELPSR